MKKILKYLSIPIAATIVCGSLALAEIGPGNIGTPQFFKRVGNAVNFINSLWTLGSQDNKIKEGNFETLNAQNINASSTAMGGDLDLNDHNIIDVGTMGTPADRVATIYAGTFDGDYLNINQGVTDYGMDINVTESPTSTDQYIRFNGYAVDPVILWDASENRFDLNYPLVVNGNATSTGHVAALGGNSDQWNQAYSWGNHASAGYLTAESDPVYTSSSWYGTTNNSTNWNIAYGWGNHATAGYLSAGNFQSYFDNALNATTTLDLTTFNATNLSSSNASLTGGTINGTTIGQTSSALAKFTSATTTGSFYGPGNFVIKENGNVGVGTNNPSSRVEVTDTKTINTNYNSLNVDLTTTQVVNSLNAKAGNFKISDSSSATGYNYGVYGESVKTGWYGYRTVGVYGKGTYSNNSAGDQLSSLDLIGLQGMVAVEGTGNNTIADGMGLYLGGSVSSGSTLTNYYGAYISAPAGTVTNKYALVTQANAGSVGIGTVSPTQKLDVRGMVIASSTTEQLRIQNGQLDNRYAGFTLANTGSLTVDLNVANATTTFNDNLQVNGVLKVGSSSTYIDINGISTGQICLGGSCQTSWPGGTPTWGSITGILSGQTDLQGALDARLSASSYYATSTWAGGNNNLVVTGNATTTGHLATLGGNSDQWNTAFDWGNHSTAGYYSAANFNTDWAGQYNATTTLNGFTNNSANWNTAYGWGNHASAGYLTAESDPAFSAWTGYTHGRLPVVNATTTNVGVLKVYTSVDLPNNAINDAMVSDTLTASWDLLTGKPATSTVVNLLDTQNRITTINATTTNADTLNVYTAVNLPANSITDAMVSNTLTCSDLQAASGVVSVGELASADFGSWTCNGSTCTIDANAVAATMLANADFGDFTCSTGTCTIDNNAISDAKVVDALTINTNLEAIFTGNVRANKVNATSTLTDLFQAESATTTESMYVGSARIWDWQERCFTMASSTWASVKIDIPLWNPSRPVTVIEERCKVKGGTSVAVTVNDGTNNLDSITCGTTLTTDSSLSNNTWTTDEAMEVDLGTVTGTVDYLNFCLRYRYD